MILLNSPNLAITTLRVKKLNSPVLTALLPRSWANLFAQIVNRVTTATPSRSETLTPTRSALLGSIAHRTTL